MTKYEEFLPYVYPLLPEARKQTIIGTYTVSVVRLYQQTQMYYLLYNKRLHEAQALGEMVHNAKRDAQYEQLYNKYYDALTHSHKLYLLYLHRVQAFSHW